MGAVGLAALAIVALAAIVVSSSGSEPHATVSALPIPPPSSPPPHVSLSTSTAPAFAGHERKHKQLLTQGSQFLLSSRARTDIDPGSLRGLEEAAGSNQGFFGRGRTSQLGQETEVGELEQLQEKETTQKDRRISDQRAPALRHSLGVR